MVLNQTTPERPVVGRFAPSPTGRMHAGNIYTALFAWLIAKSQNGSIVLRIEDLDKDRSKPEFINAVMQDFEFLGLYWDKGPYFQSARSEVYLDALHELEKHHQIYPCFCTRADLHASSAPHRGEKPIYAGTCRNLTQEEIGQRYLLRNPALRICVPNVTVSFEDMIQGVYEENLAKDCGDFIVKRSDGSFAYQLAVVVDDAEQGVNSIVRGVDLLSSTPQQIFLRKALSLHDEVSYAHVPLLVSEQGRRLSKRDSDASLEELLARYKTPQSIIGHIAYISGLMEEEEPVTPDQLLSLFEISQLASLFTSLSEIQWR